jgi:tRNA(Ile)-lysidine synthase
VPAAEPGGEPFTDLDLDSYFFGLEHSRRLLLAVSGGPDSMALLHLSHRWRKGRRTGPELVVATVDHRLRPNSRREAVDVGKFARTLGLSHHTIVWTGKKPSKGLLEAARDARYALLFGLAKRLRADTVATAHTLDDQAETFLMRLAHGSGLAGLGGIRTMRMHDGVALYRPLLDVPKSRLIAVLKRSKIRFVEDATNADKRFLRPRLRKLRADLAAEGLSPERLGTVAQRLSRADEAIESIVDELQSGVLGGEWPKSGAIDFSAAAYFRVPDEIAIRLLGRAVGRTGDEGPVELGKLEALHLALKGARATGETLRRTLAGAMVELDTASLTVNRAPPRTGKPGKRT